MLYRTVRIDELYVGPNMPARAGENAVWHDNTTSPAMVHVKLGGVWLAPIDPDWAGNPEAPVRMGEFYIGQRRPKRTGKNGIWYKVAQQDDGLHADGIEHKVRSVWENELSA